MTTIAVIAAGTMGAGVGRRLSERGARVLTSLDGRSEATRLRAEAAGMAHTSDEVIAAEADLFLSIVPPAEVVGLAERMRPAFDRAGRAPLYIDMNAVSPATIGRVQAALDIGDDGFVDAGIIGVPPGGKREPTFYLSGPAAARAAPLGAFGLQTRVLDAPIGTASALKLSYAGITKGRTAILMTMLLAAERAGALPALAEELAASQAALLGRLNGDITDLLPKAYRWVAEMEEIASFIGADHAEHHAFEAIAALYGRIADEGGADRRTLEDFAASIA